MKLDKETMKQQAQHAAEVRRAYLRRDSTVATMEDFKAEWAQLSRESTNLWVRVFDLTTDMLGALDIFAEEGEAAETLKGKYAQAKFALGAVISDPYVYKVARHAAQVILAGIDLNAVKVGESGKEQRVYRNDVGGLDAAARDASKVLGISRKREKKLDDKGAPSQVSDIWPHVVEIIKSEQGRTKLRDLLNAAGYELVPLLKATDGKATVEIPAQIKSSILATDLTPGEQRSLAADLQAQAANKEATRKAERERTKRTFRKAA